VISPAKELKRFNALPTAAVSSRKRIASKSPQIFCEETLSKERMMLDMSSGAVVWDPKTLVGSILELTTICTSIIQVRPADLPYLYLKESRLS